MPVVRSGRDAEQVRDALRAFDLSDDDAVNEFEVENRKRLEARASIVQYQYRDGPQPE